MQAKATKSMANLRQIHIASVTYAAEFQDTMPTSRNELDPYLGSDVVFQSPFGPAPGGADYWINLRGGKMSAVADPSRHIFAYDRAMLLNHEHVAVAFFDGHVEALDPEEFRALTLADANKDVDFDLPF
jgi:prepilin-type processing-associated H-X9-DG protein